MKDLNNNQKYYKRTYAKPAVYKGITFNSTLEKDFAMFLDGKIVKYKGVNYWHKPVRWEYETQEFEVIPQEEWADRTERDTRVKTIVRNKKHTLNRVIYTPDFYLPDYDLHIETKGFQFDDGLFHMRLRLFKHRYPDKAIWIVRHHHEFQMLDEVIKNVMIKKEN